MLNLIKRSGPLKPSVVITKRFEITAGHTLKLQSQTKTSKNSTTYETTWYNEQNESGQVVNRYRTWINQGNNPPYRRQTGWEQYSIEGELLDREVKYSKRDDLEYLH